MRAKDLFTTSSVYKMHLQEAPNVMKWQRQKKTCCRTCPLNKQLGNARY